MNLALAIVLPHTPRVLATRHFTVWLRALIDVNKQALGRSAVFVGRTGRRRRFVWAGRCRVQHLEFRPVAFQLLVHFAGEGGMLLLWLLHGVDGKGCGEEVQVKQKKDLAARTRGMYVAIQNFLV